MADLAKELSGLELLDKSRAYAVLKPLRVDSRSKKIQWKSLNSLDSKIENFNYNGDVDLKQKAENFSGSYHQWRDQFDGLETDIVDATVVSGLNSCENLETLDNEAPEELVDWAQAIACVLVGQGLKTNQIRRFYSGVQQQKATADKNNFNKRDVIFLRVILAYAAGREGAAKPLLKAVSAAVEKIRPEGREGYRDFEVFVKFVQSVVAYHKYYGGTD